MATISTWATRTREDDSSMDYLRYLTEQQVLVSLFLCASLAALCAYAIQLQKYVFLAYPYA